MIHFEKNYNQQTLAEEIIDHWETGKKSFTLNSSGTTGNPKPTELQRELLEWSVKRTVKTLDLKKENCFCCLPIDKTGGFMMLIRALYNQWNIYFQNASASPFVKLAIDHNYSLCSVSPQQCANALNDSPGQLARFNTVLIGGAPLSSPLESKLLDFSKKNNTRFFITYGMTETASHIAFRSPGQAFYKAIEGVQLSQQDQCLNIEIPELEYVVHTNDMVELNGNEFKVLGRKDLVINSGGIKIFPEILEPQIQSILSEMGFNRNFYLHYADDATLGQKCILVIEGEPIHDEAFILALLTRELPKYHAPRLIKYLTRFNYTATGKLIRSLE